MRKNIFLIIILIIIVASVTITAFSWITDKEASAQTETNVFYSVGQNTTDHKTGTPTMTISSGVATFSAAQIATNMGVGDKITYNISSIAYISSKQSTTVWNVITATGAIPADVTDATVGSIAHAYDSLSAAIVGAVDASHLNTTDLVTGNYILNIPCYYDTGPDQIAVTINGYTTGVNNYIKIYTPNNTSTEVNQSQRHSGVWDTGKYRLEPISGDGIELWNQYVRIDGLQISSKEHGIYLTDPNLNPGTANGFMFSNNIIKYVGTGSHSGIYDYTCGTWEMKIWNNIVYNFPNIGIGGWNNGAAYFYNNTVINCGYGIRANEAAIVAKNNISYNNTDNYNGNFNSASTNNLSGNGQNDAPGTNPRNLAVGETITFVDETDDDFHLASTDTGAKDYGANLSTDSNLAFSDDIDGNGRSLWDIGADEGSTEFVATVMQTGGDFATLNAWENAIDGNNDTDLTAAGTKVFSGSTTGSISNYASVTLYRGGVSQGITGILIYDTLAGQALIGQISNPSFVFAQNDEWRVDASNLFTISTAGGNPPIAVAKIDGTWTIADETAVAITGWTTSATNYIKIYTTSAARHDGKWNTGKYRLTISNATAIALQDRYIRLIGLQIYVNATNGNAQMGIRIDNNSGTEGNIVISSSIIRGNPTNIQDYHRGISFFNNGTGSGFEVYNNIIYNFKGGSYSAGILTGSADQFPIFFYNNTIYNCANGIYSYSTGNALTVKNNISYNNIDNYVGTFNASSTNNLSGPGTDADIPMTNARNGVPVNFVSTTSGSDDFHLASTDTGARNYGADLSSDTYLPITTDIDGQTRPTGSNAVDIGADEWLPTVQFSASSLSGSESLTSVNIEVSLSAASFPDASVSYSVTGGTATGGDIDYTLASGTATITSGNTTTNIPITIINDDIDETDETIQITLFNPTNAILGSNTIHTYTIQDNDTVGITITESGGSTSITEGGQTDTYTAVLTSEPTSDVNITITPDDQSTTNPTSLTFTSANWSTPQTVAITAVDDSSQEGSHASTITHTSSSSDSNYNNISIVSVIASITDNDGGGPWPQDRHIWPSRSSSSSEADISGKEETEAPDYSKEERQEQEQQQTPSSASTTVFTKNLAFGSRGIDVAKLQDKLKELGSFPQDVPSTGWFGLITKEAVMKYQESVGIYPCGIVGPRTRKALNGEEFISNNDYQFTQDLQYGSSGEEVKQLQTRLRDQNFFPYNVPSTGWFGRITQAAVRLFQQFYHLSQSGIVDKLMREMLNK